MIRVSMTMALFLTACGGPLEPRNCRTETFPITFTSCGSADGGIQRVSAQTAKPESESPEVRELTCIATLDGEQLNLVLSGTYCRNLIAQDNLSFDDPKFFSTGCTMAELGEFQLPGRKLTSTPEGLFCQRL